MISFFMCMFVVLYIIIFFLDLYIDHSNKEPTKENIIKSLKWPWRIIVMIVKMLVETINEGVFPLPYTLMDKDYRQTKFYFKLRKFSKNWC